ncbi:YhgE/Pip domain-containing protein, partial [Paenibacillus sp. MMS18-CY102]|uniref:YhgE/Pip domain-containing protein n=1 Tax=Paenibacillus sp. MMS18-CY102 TaxID=2682849 RepID=UPI0013653BE2
MPRWIALYFSDLRTLATNPALLVIVAGLSVLPSLYAWFNIGASWDPYGNTGGVRIAVANEDRGADMLGKPVHMGDGIVASLKANHKFGWTFTDAKEALQGVRSGKYYASITIPSDFSARIASVVTDTPRKAELRYDVNEKINAIAPKMTASGASGVMLQVSRSFVETANGAIFKLFNELGIKLQQELPAIQKLAALMFRLEESLPQIEAAVNASTADIARMQRVIGVAQQKLPEAERIAAEGAQLAQGASDFLQRTDEALSQLSPMIGDSLAALAQAAESAAALAERLQAGGSGTPSEGSGNGSGSEVKGDAGGGNGSGNEVKGDAGSGDGSGNEVKGNVGGVGEEASSGGAGQNNDVSSSNEVTNKDSGASSNVGGNGAVPDGDAKDTNAAANSGSAGGPSAGATASSSGTNASDAASSRMAGARSRAFGAAASDAAALARAREQLAAAAKLASGTAATLGQLASMAPAGDSAGAAAAASALRDARAQLLAQAERLAALPAL